MVGVHSDALQPAREDIEHRLAREDECGRTEWKGQRPARVVVVATHLRRPCGTG